VIRDKNNLDDYLYQPNTIYSNKESEKVISQIKLIFY